MRHDAPTQVIQQHAPLPPALDLRADRAQLVQPVITVTVVLADVNLQASGWADAVADIRIALDRAAAHRVEAYSCGAEGVRRAIWYADVPGAAVPRFAGELRALAGQLRSYGRLTYAPCSPVDL